jgi:hypothetical protein
MSKITSTTHLNIGFLRIFSKLKRMHAVKYFKQMFLKLNCVFKFLDPFLFNKENDVNIAFKDVVPSLLVLPLIRSM